MSNDRRIASAPTTDIPATMAALFQEYDFSTVDVESHAVTVIERTLEQGTWDELRWLFQTYGPQRIADYVQHYGHRRLSKMTFNYWRKLLGVDDYRPAPWGEIRDQLWRS